MGDQDDLPDIEWRFIRFTADNGIVVTESPPPNTTILPSAILSNISKTLIVVSGEGTLLVGGLEVLHAVNKEGKSAVSLSGLESVSLGYDIEGILLSSDESFLVALSHSNTRLTVYSTSDISSVGSPSVVYTAQLEKPLLSVLSRPKVSNQFTLLCEDGSIYHMVVGSDNLIQLSGASPIKTIAWHPNGLFILVGQDIRGDELVLLNPLGKTVSHIESIKEFLPEGSCISSVRWISETQFIAIYSTDIPTEFETVLCNLEAATDDGFWTSKTELTCVASDELANVPPQRFFEAISSWSPAPALITGYSQSSDLALLPSDDLDFEYSEDGFMPVLPISIEYPDETSPKCLLVDWTYGALIDSSGAESAENGKQLPVVWVVDASNRIHGFYLFCSEAGSTEKEISGLVEASSSSKITRSATSSDSYSTTVDTTCIDLKLENNIEVPERYPTSSTSTSPWFTAKLTQNLLDQEASTVQEGKKKSFESVDEEAASTTPETESTEKNKEAMESKSTDSTETVEVVELSEEHEPSEGSESSAPSEPAIAPELESNNFGNAPDTPADSPASHNDDPNISNSSNISEVAEMSPANESGFSGFSDSELPEQGEEEVEAVSHIGDNTKDSIGASISESAQNSINETSDGSEESDAIIKANDVYPDPETTAQSLDVYSGDDSDWSGISDNEGIADKHVPSNIFGTASSSPRFSFSDQVTSPFAVATNSPKDSRKSRSKATPTGSPVIARKVEEDEANYDEATPKKSGNPFAPPVNAPMPTESKSPSPGTPLEASSGSPSSVASIGAPSTFKGKEKEQSSTPKTFAEEKVPKVTDLGSYESSSSTSGGFSGFGFGKYNSEQTPFAQTQKSSSSEKPKTEVNPWDPPAPPKSSFEGSTSAFPPTTVSTSAFPPTTVSTSMFPPVTAPTSSLFGQQTNANPFGGASFGSTGFASFNNGSVSNSPFKTLPATNALGNGQTSEKKSFSLPPPAGLKDSDSDSDSDGGRSESEESDMELYESYNDDFSGFRESQPMDSSFGFGDRTESAEDEGSESVQYNDQRNTVTQENNPIEAGVLESTSKLSVGSSGSGVFGDGPLQKHTHTEEVEKPKIRNPVDEAFDALEFVWTTSRKDMDPLSRDKQISVSDLQPFNETICEIEAEAPSMDDIFINMVDQFKALQTNFVVIRSLLWLEEDYSQVGAQDIAYADTWKLSNIKDLASFEDSLNKDLQKATSLNEYADGVIEAMRNALNNVYLKLAKIEEHVRLLQEEVDPRTQMLRPLPRAAVELRSNVNGHLNNVKEKMALVENEVSLFKLQLTKENNLDAGPTIEGINKSLTILGTYGKSSLKHARQVIADFEKQMPDINPSLYNKLLSIKPSPSKENKLFSIDSARIESQARHSAVANRLHTKARLRLGDVLRKRDNATIFKRAEAKTVDPCVDKRA